MLHVAVPLTMLAAASGKEGPHIMNAGGVPYQIANPDSSSGEYIHDFGNHESFDVYSKVETRYSQVYWTRNSPVALPDEIVKRFDGKVMAITGYEIDQVVQTPQVWAHRARAHADPLAVPPL
eukprot:gene11352-2067_t